MNFLTRILLISGSLVSVASACSEPTQPAIAPNPPPAPAVPVNTAPRALAGWWTIGVPLSVTSTVLRGSATDAESNIQSYAWTKVSGPASVSITSPHSAETRVEKLEQGTYEFELAVTDRGGLTGKDTVAVVVYDPRVADANAFVFSYLQWGCPMGCSVIIDNLQKYVSPSTRIRVFVNEIPGLGEAAEWIEAKPATEWTADVQYVYAISENSLGVYTDHGDGTVEIKITF